MTDRTCPIEGCDRPVHGYQMWCKMHYNRWRRHGDPLICRGLPRHADIRVRFMEQVSISPSGCWLWTGRLNIGGYGTFYVDGEGLKVAHRVAYEWFVEPIPEGLHLDHVWANGCRHRHCVNWTEHLESVTPAENIRRAWAHRIATECSKGHEFTPENTYIQPSNGRRVCRICNSAHTRAWERRRRDRLRAEADLLARGVA